MAKAKPSSTTEAKERREQIKLGDLPLFTFRCSGSTVDEYVAATSQEAAQRIAELHSEPRKALTALECVKRPAPGTDVLFQVEPPQYGTKQNRKDAKEAERRGATNYERRAI